MLAFPRRKELCARPLETDRLALVPIDATDGPELWHAVQNSRGFLAPWLPWVQYTVDQASSIRFAEACATDWDQGRALRFVVRSRRERTLLGVVGLESCVHLHKSCELGYWLRQEATRHGLMTEAAREVIRFAFSQVGVHRIRVAAATTNHASLAVIARLSFRFEGIARQAEWCDNRWLDHAVFGLLAIDPR